MKTVMGNYRNIARRPRWNKAFPGAVACLTALIFLLSLSLSLGCVGKDLTIGVVNSPREIVYAELIAQLVTERTGTTVKIVPYKDVRELYRAVTRGDVGIIIENTDRGFRESGLPVEEDGKSPYEALKRQYREKLGLIWLRPVSADGGGRYYAPVISAETMGNLPALPKLINRLADVLTEENYMELTLSAKGEEKARTAARHFLKVNKLI